MLHRDGIIFSELKLISQQRFLHKQRKYILAKIFLPCNLVWTGCLDEICVLGSSSFANIYKQAAEKVKRKLCFESIIIINVKLHLTRLDNLAFIQHHQIPKCLKVTIVLWSNWLGFETYMYYMKEVLKDIKQLALITKSTEFQDYKWNGKLLGHLLLLVGSGWWEIRNFFIYQCQTRISG